MKRKVKRCAAALLVCFLAGTFAACSAGIEVLDSADEENWYFDVSITVDRLVVATLEADADVNPATKQPWRMREWLSAYFDALISPECGARDMRVSYEGTTQLNNQIYYAFRLVVPKDGNMKESFSVPAKSSVRTNLFIRTVDASRPDRFNAWQKRFSEAYARYESDSPAADDYCSEMGVILFGARVFGKDEELYDERLDAYYTQKLPSLPDAFGMSKYDLLTWSDFVLRDLWYSSNKMSTNADTKYTDNQGGAYYLFEKTLGGGDTTVRYRYYRADPTGWYLTALLLGGLTTLLIIVTVRRRKKRIPPDVPPPAPPDDPYGGRY